MKNTRVFKREVLIQGTDHMDDGRAERVNWPVRHPRDHLDRKPLAPSGQRARWCNQNWGLPRQTGVTVRGGVWVWVWVCLSVCLSTPTILVSWAAEHSWTTDLGAWSTAFKGPLTEDAEQGKGEEQTWAQTGSGLALWPPGQSEAFRKHRSERWTHAVLWDPWTEQLTFLMKHTRAR